MKENNKNNQNMLTKEHRYLLVMQQQQKTTRVSGKTLGNSSFGKTLGIGLNNCRTAFILASLESRRRADSKSSLNFQFRSIYCPYFTDSI